MSTKNYLLKPKIVMMVTNQVSSDPRVTKEAKTLQRVAEVTVLGYYRSSLVYKNKEKIENFVVWRAQDKNWFKSSFILINYLNFFRYYYRMNQYFIKEVIKIDPDIIHCHDLDTLLAGYLAKRKISHRKPVKLIYDMHEIWTRQGLPLAVPILKLFEKIEKFILKRVDGAITVNESMIGEISQMYHYRFKVPILALYNCPPLRKINLKKNNFSRFKGKKIIFYHGGYMKNRGLEELILAAKYFKKNAVVILRIVLDKKTEQELNTLIKKNNLANRVFLVPPVKMLSMIDESTGADIGVIPYIPTNVNNKLSTPNKLFEYPMAGMALAVSNLVEFKKIIKKYRNGVIFNPRDPKSIAKAINYLIDKPLILAEMKKRSLLQARECNWQIEEKKLLLFYESLIHLKGS